MSEGDRYANLRNLPFDILAGALGIDLSLFKRRKSNTEWNGKCPMHSAVTNKTSFSYSVSGKFRCFSCLKKGRTAIDLAMLVRDF